MTRALVLRAAGTNCDRETAHALRLAGAEVVSCHVSQLAADPSQLDGVGVLALPGGFTYGDDIAAGRVLAVELARHLADALARHVDRGGVVIGICNGFQVLVKLGLLPGPFAAAEPAQQATLTDNDSDRFESRWVRMISAGNSPLLPAGETLEMPVAHREGKLVLPDGQRAALEAAGQVVLRYVGPGDEPDPGYPHNPNGSAGDVAGICDAGGRVLGLMPHPERHVARHQHRAWTRTGGDPDAPGDGLALFCRAVQLGRS